MTTQRLLLFAFLPLLCACTDNGATEPGPVTPASQPALVKKSTDRTYNGKTLSDWFAAIEETDYKENRSFWSDVEKAINQLSEEHADEVPFLISILRLKAIEPHGALHCQVALTKIGRPAAEPVSRLLSIENTRLKTMALDVLKRIGASAGPAVPKLIEIYDDADPAIQKDARRLLYKLCRHDHKAREFFVEILRDGAVREKIYAAKRLIKVKHSSPALTAVLHELKNQTDPQLNALLQQLQSVKNSAD